jgi:hypothetical protein
MNRSAPAEVLWFTLLTHRQPVMSGPLDPAHGLGAAAAYLIELLVLKIFGVFLVAHESRFLGTANSGRASTSLRLRGTDS